MAWFFVDAISADIFQIEGEDARHIARSLRMEQGETVTVCDQKGIQHTCVIRCVSPAGVSVQVLEKQPCQNEPNVRVTLYQALPKGDKMDFIVQKAVELGVHAIVPVMTQRCVSRPDAKALLKKSARWQKIAKNASQQSRRGIVPQIGQALTLKQAAQQSAQGDRTLVFYECGGLRVGDILAQGDKNIAVFIGSEGGFAQEEINCIKENGGVPATLGKRILRAETAPLAALSVLMYATGNFA